MGYLYRCFRLADRACLSQLYKSLVLPMLSYCSSVWDPLEFTHINKLERVQRFAARLATGRWSKRSEPIRKELGWPSLVDQRKVQKPCLCKRILLGGSLFPATCFQHHQLFHLRHANSKPLCRKAVRTNYCKQSFFCEHRDSVEWHPRGHSVSGSGLSFQKAIQTTFLLTCLITLFCSV